MPVRVSAFFGVAPHQKPHPRAVRQHGFPLPVGEGCEYLCKHSRTVAWLSEE